jgi:predicted transcriptional regulator
MMSKKLLEIAAEIVQNQVSNNPMSSEEIVSSLKYVFTALQTMQKSEIDGTLLEGGKGGEEGVGGEKAQDKPDAKSSVQDDKIVCLECGAEMRQLTAKHLGAHNLTPREYKQKYGFPLKQPLSAKSLTRARSKAAKKRGLPENLMKYHEMRKQQKGASTEMAAGGESTHLAPELTKAAPKRSKGKKAEQ